jgi:DNA replication protein DnaC
MTPDEINAEAAAIWLADHRERLVANLLANRPAQMAAPGDLEPDLAGWAERLAAGSKQNAILAGPVGTGKTWAVWKAAEQAVRCGYEGLVVITAAARFRRIVAPATADPREFERYLAAGLLAIDDLATVRLSEWDMDHLGELIDTRWAAQLPTVVTSNKTDLKSLLGPRISSRLSHNALIVPMDGPDRRRQS